MGIDNLDRLRKRIKEKEDKIEELLKKLREGDASLRDWLDKFEQVRSYKGIQAKTKTTFVNGVFITKVID